MLYSVTLAAALIVQQSTPSPVKPSKPLGEFDNPKESLHTAGIRGTVDAGGYSASATLKSQSEFYELLTNVQVAALQPAWTIENPCSDSDSFRATAISQLARGEFAAAAASLQRVLPTNNEPGTHQLLGLAYEGTGQLEAAAEQFRTAAETRPGDSSMLAAGVAFLLLGDLERAEAEFRHSLVQTSGPPNLTRLGLGATLFQRGQIDGALTLFLEVAKAQPLEMAPFRFIAIALGSADSVVLARIFDALTSITRQSPKSGGAHYALACAQSAAAKGAPEGSQAAEILAQLQQAVRLNPELADAHFRLAREYAAREDFAPAIAEYHAALDCDPHLVEAHYRLSQLYARSGQQQLAAEQRELHRKLREQQKQEIENGKAPVRLPSGALQPCQSTQ